MPQLVEATLMLLRESSACQQVESDSDVEDDTEHDEVLMDAVSDLLPAFAKSMGSQFEPIFVNLFEPLMKFAVCTSVIVSISIFLPSIYNNIFVYLEMQKASRPPQDRTMVVACLAEVAQEMGSPIASYIDVRI